MNEKIILATNCYKYYLSNVTHEQAHREYEKLKQELLCIGLPVSGSIQKLFARCGSTGCPCATDDFKRHGPYLRWHHRKGIRQCTVGIEENILPMIEQGINNRYKIERLVGKMLTIGDSVAESLSDNKKNHDGNSKKIKS
jgi:hypothetical protein